MKKTLLFATVGIVTFVVCHFLVYRIGAQFIKTAPSAEAVINRAMLITSFLMTIVALLKIHALLYPKRNRW